MKSCIKNYNEVFEFDCKILNSELVKVKSLGKILKRFKWKIIYGIFISGKWKWSMKMEDIDGICDESIKCLLSPIKDHKLLIGRWNADLGLKMRNVDAKDWENEKYWNE